MELAVSPDPVVNARQVTPLSVDAEAPVPVPTQTIGTPEIVSYSMSTTEFPAKNRSVSPASWNEKGLAQIASGPHMTSEQVSANPINELRLK